MSILSPARFGARLAIVVTLFTMAIAAALAAPAPTPASPVVISQVISREDPRFDAASAQIVVGQNGLVYVNNLDRPGIGGYAIRMKPDGTDRQGFSMVHAESVGAVNSDNIQISRIAHFSHTAATYDSDRNQLGSFTDLNNTNYDVPQGIAVGASGDFYAMDAFAQRIVRLDEHAKPVKIYSLPKPPGWNYAQFGVCEAKQVFLLQSVPYFMLVHFDGTLDPVKESMPSWPWTLDASGIMYVLANTGDSVTEYDIMTGQAIKTIKLDVGDRLATDQYPVQNIQIYGNTIFVKRQHPFELFAKYDATTGAYLGSVYSQHETLSASYPSARWTAGGPEPFKIELDGVQRTAPPDWRVQMAPFGTGFWRTLDYAGGHVAIPADFGGLYQVRVTAGSGISEYLLRDIVNVVRPDARGTITTMTPQSRLYYARGEDIPVQIYIRCLPADMPGHVQLSLVSAGNVLSSTTLHGAASLTYTIPADFTRYLQAGLYQIVGSAAGMTSAAQPISIGAGSEAATPFKVIQYGDYGSPIPVGNVFDSGDQLQAQLDSSRRLGINFYTARINGYFPLAWANDATGKPYLDTLSQRLSATPNSVAPEKTDLLFPTGQAIAAYGASGGGMMGILMGMDHGLPLGTGIDAEKPEATDATLVTGTKALAAIPGFKGWDWAANWWDNDQYAFTEPGEQDQYNAALKTAKDTGAWSPILDTVGDTIRDWQVQAQERFAKLLDANATGKVTASSGPYRRPPVYPPISFSNVDQIDLHYQAEQISTPLWTTQAGAYERIPGKPNWIHPEMYNDSGTGEQVMPTLWDSLIGGVDGIGISGNIPNWGDQPLDWRTAYEGMTSVVRNTFQTIKSYGDWLTRLAPSNPVAIVVSRRQVKIDTWASPGGQYFSRQFEAYQALLFAHRPADYVFIEDLKPGALNRYKAVLVIDQWVEMDPELKAALDSAQAAGVPIYADNTCRSSLVSSYRQLGLGFDHIENDAGFNDDSATFRYQRDLLADAKILESSLASVPPVMGIDEPEVFASQKVSGSARFLLLVNNTFTPMPPELIYRVNMASSTTMPIRCAARIPDLQAGAGVYDMLAMRRVQPDPGGVVYPDMRTTDARLYAILPSPISGVALRIPESVHAGSTLEFASAVLGEGGSPIEASLPMHVRIEASDGTTLYDRDGATEDTGHLTTSFDVPVTGAQSPLTVSPLTVSPLTVSPLTVTVTDLVGGKVATAKVAVLPAQASDFTLTSFASGDARSVVGTNQTTDAPPADTFGVHLRDVAISNDGKLALANAFQWGDNLYAVDVATGKLAWHKRLGQYWAFGPQAAGDGFTATGFDFNTPEGYHLYRLRADGGATRRFAVYGLPQELSHVMTISISPNDATLSFASPPSGNWVAASGDLGVAVWQSDGTKLWSIDRAGDSMTPEAPLWIKAAGDDTLLVADGLNVTGYDPTTGKKMWSHLLAKDGSLTQVITRNGAIYILTSAFGGTVYIVKNGEISDSLHVQGEEFDVSPDGTAIAATATDQSAGHTLRLYRIGQGMMWAATSPFTWRFPAIAGDGRVAAVDESGYLNVYHPDGTLAFTRDLGWVAVPKFLPDGDLLVATWNGLFIRIDSTGKTVWQTRVTPSVDDIRPTLLAADTTPTTKMTGWTNSSPASVSFGSPLKGSTTVAMTRPGNALQVLQGTNPQDLVSGKYASPANGYIPAASLSPFLWTSNITSIEMDRGKEMVRLSGIALYEDPTDPNSWLRDIELDYWDDPNQVWVPVQRLLSDSAVHAHKLVKPVEASKFRLVLPAYSYSPVKLQQIVLYGQSLGPAYPPDVRAGKPVVTLFDENVSNMNAVYSQGFDTGFSIKTGADAYSGATYFVFDPDKNSGMGNLMRPMNSYGGSDVDGWLFDISPDPKPGQYRYIQLAIKALSPNTTHVDLYFQSPEVSPGLGIDLKPGGQWGVYRFDIAAWWAQHSAQPLRIQTMYFRTVGGAAAFDQIVLGRTQADLDGVKPIR